MQYSEQRFKQHTLETCREYWESFKATSNYFWAIETLIANGRHIGNIQAHINQSNLLAGISLLIGDTQSHEKRYGEEAFKGVCRFLFFKKKIRKITAGTMAENFPMLKLMDRIGMIEDGVRKDHYLYNGKPVDIVYKAIFKHNWVHLQSEDGDLSA